LPFGREQTRVTQVGVMLLIPDTNFWIDAKRPIDFPALARGEPFAATAGKPVNGTVRIVLRHRHEAWAAPALPSRDDPAIGTTTRGRQHERWLRKEGLL